MNSEMIWQIVASNGLSQRVEPFLPHPPKQNARPVPGVLCLIAGLSQPLF